MKFYLITLLIPINLFALELNMHEYNKLKKGLDLYINDYKKYSESNNSIKRDSCINIIKKNNNELLNNIDTFNNLVDSNLTKLNRNIESEYHYYANYCEDYKIFYPLLLTPNLKILKEKCDKRTPSYEDYINNQISPEKERILAEILCLKMNLDLVNCINSNLEFFINSTKATQDENKKHLLFFPSIMLK